MLHEFRAKWDNGWCGHCDDEENDVWEGRGWGWYRVGSSDMGAADFLVQDQFKAVRSRTGRIRRDGLELKKQ